MTYDELNELSIVDLATRFRELKDKLTKAKEDMAIVQKEFDTIRKSILPEKIENSGLDSPVNVTGVGKISLRAEIFASIRSERKEEAKDWLVSNGHEALIKETVNASTLKAFVKEQLENGEEIPDELFLVTPYTMATLTKG